MLSDFLELNKLEKEQLIQLCEILYTLLKDRKVTANVQSAPFTFNPYFPNFTNLPNPCTPYQTTGQQMDNGATFTGQVSFGDPE